MSARQWFYWRAGADTPIHSADCLALRTLCGHLKREGWHPVGPPPSTQSVIACKRCHRARQKLEAES